MTIQHTPGPWVDFVTGKIKNGAGGELIATVHKLIHPMEPTLREETAEANARLIAAAPDLLAACKVALDTARCADWPDDCAASEKLIRAIARVEGKEAV